MSVSATEQYQKTRPCGMHYRDNAPTEQSKGQNQVQISKELGRMTLQQILQEAS